LIPGNGRVRSAAVIHHNDNASIIVTVDPSYPIKGRASQAAIIGQASGSTIRKSKPGNTAKIIGQASSARVVGKRF